MQCVYIDLYVVPVADDACAETPALGVAELTTATTEHNGNLSGRKMAKAVTTGAGQPPGQGNPSRAGRHVTALLRGPSPGTLSRDTALDWRILGAY